MGRISTYPFFMIFLLFAGPAFASDVQVDYVLVKKSEKKMFLLSQGKTVKEYDVVFGDNPKGHKQQEGDERTPEGKYTLDYKKGNSSYFKAIHISYPNKDDRLRAKAANVDPGGQIMIHGQRNGWGWLSWVTQRFDWTNGCIAVTDSDMEEIWQIVKVGTTIEIRP